MTFGNLVVCCVLKNKSVDEEQKLLYNKIKNQISTRESDKSRNRSGKKGESCAMYYDNWEERFSEKNRRKYKRLKCLWKLVLVLSYVFSAPAGIFLFIACISAFRVVSGLVRKDAFDIRDGMAMFLSFGGFSVVMFLIACLFFSWQEKLECAMDEIISKERSYGRSSNQREDTPFFYYSEPSPRILTAEDHDELDALQKAIRETDGPGSFDDVTLEDIDNLF